MPEDVRIIENKKLRKIISKGLNYKERKTINWEKVKKKQHRGKLRQSD